jgi:hypothetical protein
VIALALLLALDLAGYQRELQGIDAQLARGETKPAAAAARKLLEQKLDGGLSPDAFTLQPIADGAPRRPRLQQLLKTLQTQPLAKAASDSKNLLQTVRERQRADMGNAGGELRDTLMPEPTLLEWIVSAIGRAWTWFWETLKRFYDWINSLFPDSHPDDQPGKQGAGGVHVVPVVLVLVGLILVIVIALALRAALRPEPPRKEASSDKASSKKDDDPLSRSVSGWEERAVALAAEGRYREAIRAWYHAILVHAASAGLLQYQRGRTNWEYVHLMSPAISWRPLFSELTRLFEREWYGRAESSEQELQLFQRDAREILVSLRRAA